MQLVRPLVKSLFIIIIFGSSCTVLKKEDPEKAIYDFFQAFEKNLSKSDDEILKQFETHQSAKSVLSVIRILQNKSEEYIDCAASFGAPQITFNDTEIRASIPLTVSVKNIKEGDVEQIFLPFYLKVKNDGYVITKVEGEELYNQIVRMKNNSSWEIAELEEIEKRVPIFKQAKTLQNKYDSVIWYATYNAANYFYVVEGDWKNYFMNHETRNIKNAGVKMGLADSTGSLIIPMEYDLIGTIAFEKQDIVEVTKGGKVGYFDIAKRQIVIEPQYDFIVPYEEDNVWAMVKQDTVYGWVDKQFKYTAGFPSAAAKEWIDTFSFLRKNLRLKPGNQVFCEIPNHDSMGSGIVIPSAYFVKNGIFEYIESGIATTAVPMRAWTEYKETRGSFIQQISAGINALISTVSRRYLEGREEFYTTNQIVFFDSRMDTVSVTEIAGDEISIHVIDSSLLEAVTPHDAWFGENDISREYILPCRSYFSISAEGAVHKLSSERYYPETQFVKLDSSYLTGKFQIYNQETQTAEQTTFLSAHTINWMRNDILAAYGYSFPGTDDGGKFDTKWYNPKYNTIEEFSDQLSEIDKHNLAFLERVIAAFTAKPI